MVLGNSRIVPGCFPGVMKQKYCLLFVEKKIKKSRVFCLSATCVLGGHIWSRTCTACGFFCEGIYLRLTREAARLPRMCLKFRGGKTVRGKLHPAAGCRRSAGQTGSIFTLPFSLKARRTRPPPLMSNSCGVDFRGVAAVTASPPPAPSLSCLLCGPPGSGPTRV